MGKPTLKALKHACPAVDERLVSEHWARLDERYFETFDEERIVRHLRGLSRVTAEHPVELLLDVRDDGTVECTVLAFDYPGEFSLIAGVLAALGLDIATGDVFTYGRPGPARPQRRRKVRVRPPAPEERLRRRRIIDRFAGSLTVPLQRDVWAEELRRRMGEVIGLLERGDAESRTRARQSVNEMVARRLAEVRLDSHAVLYPVQIQVDNDSADATCMKVVSEDTPFFLYALSTALALHDISIERVSIRTIERRIEDEFYFVNARGEKIVAADDLNQVKLSVLLTKQFTYFLAQAPDPYAALCRFETLVADIVRLPQQGRWFELLSNPDILQGLARLLGASDFLWEDFIRLQYETLLPMLRPQVEGRRFCEPLETLEIRLEKALRGAKTPEEQARRLNEFKDREIFLTDVDHILTQASDFRALSERLTALAEKVVNAAVRLTFAHLARRFGRPHTVAGIEARFAVLGLGKFGGAALGYGSDLEVLFVYSDNGRTSGPEVIENREFFERLARDSMLLIRAKREGVFQVDLRLRPFGQDGPLACSLETFCRYYGRGGAAHSSERLALVRLRAIGGDPSLGGQIERLRDETLYASPAIDLAEIRQLREKQLREFAPGGRLNAKFSSGALVDLEYTVQILQVTHGRNLEGLRTPRIHQALETLAQAGVLAPEEADGLVGAYDFLRRLINGLRMLRGNANDLFLPPVDSDEYAHLARRMGYEAGGALTPARRLHMEFETRTALVRAFVERRLGRDSLPGPAVGNVADLVLSESVPGDLREAILKGAGFRDPQRAYVNLRDLAGDGARRDLFAKLAVLACDILAQKPDPDMALNNWERFCQSLDRIEGHFETLLSQPMRLDLLLSLFAGSQFLADTLVLNPEFLDWVTVPEKVRVPGRREDLEAELRVLARQAPDHPAWLNELRRFRRREILRIGVRDICLGVAMREVLSDLSVLAEAVIQAALDQAWERLEAEAGGAADGAAERFCVMALGKLGGGELNYSSDVDLVALYANPPEAPGEAEDAAETIFARVMEGLRYDLSQHTSEGYAYRVDLRLRPYGRAGQLVHSASSLLDYYANVAALWEVQALLKMRPVAGNLALGEAFLEKVRPVLLRAVERRLVVQSIEAMRNETMRTATLGSQYLVDVKNGLGGLRDAEFAVQGLQLLHARERPELLVGNTLAAIEALERAGILPADAGRQLSRDYIFLRRVEHCLQLFEDRQTHSIPAAPEALDALAKRALGMQATADGFLDELKDCLARVRCAYRERLLGETEERRGDFNARPSASSGRPA